MGVLRTLRGTVGHSVAPLLQRGRAADAGDLGCRRSGPLGRPRLDPRGRPDSPSPAGRDPAVRSRAPDREVAAGQSPDLALSARQAQGHPPGPRSPAVPRPARTPDATRRLPGHPPAELQLTLMNDHTLFLGKFLTQITRGNPDRQHRAVQPLAVADDGPQHRLGPRAGPRRAGRRHRTDHPGDRRACPPGMPRHRRRTRPRFRPVAPRAVRIACRISRSSRETSATWRAILADRGIEQVDHVISGLPVPSFPRDLQHALVPHGRGRSSGPRGRSTRSPRSPGSTGRSTAGISTRSSSPSSPATCPPPGPTSAAGPRTSPDRQRAVAMTNGDRLSPGRPVRTWSTWASI